MQTTHTGIYLATEHKNPCAYLSLRPLLHSVTLRTQKGCAAAVMRLKIVCMLNLMSDGTRFYPAFCCLGCAVTALTLRFPTHTPLHPNTSRAQVVLHIWDLGPCCTRLSYTCKRCAAAVVWLKIVRMFVSTDKRCNKILSCILLHTLSSHSTDLALSNLRICLSWCTIDKHIQTCSKCHRAGRVFCECRGGLPFPALTTPLASSLRSFVSLGVRQIMITYWSQKMCFISR